jgi:hypothetical protein
LHHNVDPKELEGWLFADSGHDRRFVWQRKIAVR